MTYRSIQDDWDSRASIKTRPKRLFSSSEYNLSILPVSKQPLLIHPDIQSLPEALYNYILVQSSYFYMHDIGLIETELVNKAALYIANDHVNIPYTCQMKHDALTVIIDEAYHAHVALDFIKQVETITGIECIELPKKSGVAMGVENAASLISSDLKKVFEIVCVCLSEHTLTKDIAGVSRDTNVSEYFKNVMLDHLIDEGRHVRYFKQILTHTWNNLSQKEQDLLSVSLAEFVDLSLKDSNKLDFEIRILSEVGFSESSIQRIFGDTFFDSGHKGSAVTDNYLTVLRDANILSNKLLRDTLTVKGFHIEDLNSAIE